MSVYTDGRPRKLGNYVYDPAPDGADEAEAKLKRATAALEFLCREYTEAQRALHVADEVTGG